MFIINYKSEFKNVLIFKNLSKFLKIKLFSKSKFLYINLFEFWKKSGLF